MEHALLEQVKHTRVFLRKELLNTIFEEFDAQRMKLTEAQRLEKYQKMLESPFRFFRGSAYLFYFDMTKISSIFHTPTLKPTWIQGDMHMDNFGAFQNEDGTIVFDVNDFDEGYVGSYLYDIIRMSVSIALYLEEQGVHRTAQETAIQHLLNSYMDQLKRFQRKQDDPLTLVFTKENTKGPAKKLLKKLEKRQSSQFLQDISYVNEDGQRLFISNDEIQPVTADEYNAITSALPAYKIKDIACKYGSGTASIGLKRYYILVENKKGASGVGELVLEMKEVRTAIPAYFLPYNQEFWKHYEHQGARVVGTQKAMHHLEDPHLDYITMNEQEFYIRERSPYKKKVKPKNYKNVEDYYATTSIMGQIAAKIHARADIDYSHVFTYHSEDEILKTIGKDRHVFVDQVILQAMNYKDTVSSDFDLFKNWVDTQFKQQYQKDLSQ
ncbi:DUF2252 family protein [Lysinibacillus sp. fkY74-1]|uniref:DUF2252 family protein n=1 Tax=Lysinibacillus sphaericus TaxID=1421 RepID=UPI0004DF2C8C|nr:DUF2252 family protein [Lysinibacillus sphaericus]MBG9691501.1 hypothetical protein [Lysinibacillus sphaericus]MBG9754800.1 hypothetical protein [Lysinibacillus sphaericus]QPA54705.1 DUF2252 family protein [Lysinibacillus sphaericus]QPA59073.1 DUF2252 family protein [Lysinibacillus sphaericus]QTB13908.1 DUF2252 family protein [Lysinibacillus sphaericus]